MEAGFFLAKPCRTWWRSAPLDVSDMKELCMEVSVVVLQVPFTWDFVFTVLHMQHHAHTPPFQKLAIALAIGFSSESVLKYERLKHKKRNLSAWWFKVAQNEFENASFAQSSAHRDSRIWRPEWIELECKRRARERRPTLKSAYPTHRFCHSAIFRPITPYNVWFF